MTVLVTGANGQLGCWLRLVVARLAAGSIAPAPAANPPFRFLFSDIADLSDESRSTLQKLGGEGVDFSTVHLDVTDLSAVQNLVRREGVDAIVNCAGFTNVDAAESRPETAELLNVQAPENLALAMRDVNGLLIHVSTDYIFGGEDYDGPIPEDRAAAPLGVYARTKWEGEEAIRRVACRHVILRTAWLFSEFGRNFVRTMLRLTAERPQIKVVDDQRGTPTYARDLAEVILTVLGSPAPADVYNYTDAGECTWYEFACEILRQALSSFVGSTGESRSACEILPCRSDEFPSPVRRPAYSVLDKSRIRAAFGLDIPAWPESLRKCLKNIL